MQFCVAVDEFLRFCSLERQLSIHTVQAYSADLRDFRKWLKTDIAIGDVSPDTLKQYLEDMVGERKLSVATVRRRFACLRAFFRRAAGKDQCPDPFANWHPLLPRRKRLPRTLSRSEAAFLLSARNDARGGAGEGDQVFAIIVRLMVVTGMRVGELCKLHVDDLSPDCSVVRIHGKGARERVAYITDAALRRDLQQIIRQRRTSRLGGGALFVNRHGAPMRSQSVRSKLRRLAKEAGLEPPRHPAHAATYGGDPTHRNGRGYPLRAAAVGPFQHRHDGNLHARLRSGLTGHARTRGCARRARCGVT